MFRKLKTYLEYGNHFCGIEHTIQSGEELIYTTILKKSKNTVDVENSFKDNSIGNTITKLRKEQHIFLVINNDQVLLKHIKSEQVELEKLVYKAYPNINIDEFFYEIMSQENNHFVSICRKDYVNELVAEYKAHSKFVINISLGNALASEISHFVQEKLFVTSNANISLENHKISSIEKKEIESIKTYKINGLEITSEQILSFSAALAVVLKNFNTITNFDLLKKAVKSDYLHSRYHSLFLKFGLLSILGILLVNFLIFNHYFNQVSTLQQTSQINQTTKQKILEINEEVTKSQKMVEDMLNSNISKSSFYVNAIIMKLPNSILLSELNYQPIIKRIKTGKTIEVEKNIMLLSGKSNNSELFSKWVTDLEATNWIKKVEISNYHDASKSLSDFSLKLSIENDKEN